MKRHMMKRHMPTILSLTVLSLLVVLSGPGQASPESGPAVGKAIPVLTLPDVAGHKHSLSEKGQPMALLFFCGCAPCHDFARLWSQVQQAGDLAPQAASRSSAAHTPATVAVFLGGAADARAFAAQTGLDLSKTLLLLDPSDQMGQRFGVLQCPRVFVTDGARRLVYTSPDDPAPRLSAPALVSRTLTAWHHQNGAKKAAPEKKAAP